ncbi:MAG: hypothetical protein WCK93_02625 [Nitrosomonadales bacterium]|jgi:hypothetical protein
MNLLYHAENSSAFVSNTILRGFYGLGNVSSKFYRKRRAIDQQREPHAANATSANDANIDGVDANRTARTGQQAGRQCGQQHRH